MKKLFALMTLVAFVGTTTFAQTTKAPEMKFEKTTVDYGTIEQNSEPLRTFSFKNEGDAPLIITGARGSCGCTVPSWPKEPIPVGGTGEIQVQFDSKGKKNKQSKRVTITANTDPAQTFLTIKGEVTPDPAAEAAAEEAAAEEAPAEDAGDAPAEDGEEEKPAE